MRRLRDRSASSRRARSRGRRSPETLAALDLRDRLIAEAVAAHPRRSDVPAAPCGTARWGALGDRENLRRAPRACLANLNPSRRARPNSHSQWSLVSDLRLGTAYRRPSPASMPPRSHSRENRRDDHAHRSDCVPGRSDVYPGEVNFTSTGAFADGGLKTAHPRSGSATKHAEAK